MNKTLAAFDSLQPLEIKDFTEFYRATHGNENNSYKPFAWQERLAEQVCCGTWPDFLKLPTSSGKTAAIDIAVFALAYQACAANRPQGILTAARRIFFVVDRRIIVNEAYRQTRKTAQLLWDAVVGEEQKTNSVLKRVGKWLQTLANDPTAPPLDCFELRGGIYRDDAWVRSPMQPTVLTSTVDQVGSRMLFRGYGVSDRNLSIHAAMTTCDSLIILDEAHCSNPFSQTVESIARYRSERWADEPVATPFSLVQMTATPPQYLGKKTLFSLHEHDYEVDAMLEKRHACAKPTILVHDPSAKGKTLPTSLAKKFLQHTQTMVDQGCKKIAVVVNRIAIARETFKLLHSKYGDRVSLMIGRMRPIDREVLTTELQSKFASGLETVSDLPQFVVATQCLEVGADLDFDGMISQCASLDALRQRFGRLNRLGNTTNCYGVIVAAEGDIPPEDKLNPDKPLDPVYGNALARTWHWLNDVKDVNGEIDFGIKAFEKKSVGHEQKFGLLCAPSPDAPVLMPAHVDMLCQTSPRPTPEPEVASYLHGPNRGLPEVRVCWRADLKMQNASTSDQLRTRTRLWNEAVAICPPSSAECLSVPVFFVKKWLRGEKLNDSSSDVLGETEEEDVPAKGSHDVFGRCVLVWKGTTRKSSRKVKTSKSKMNENGSYLVDHTNLDRLRTGDTIVIPAEFGGWIDFGYVPNAPHEPEPNAWFRNLEKSSSDECETNSEFASIDVADTAFAQSRARTILRVHEKLRVDDYAKSLFKKLLNEVRKPEADLRLATWTVLAKQIVADVIEARRDALVGEDIADASTGQHMSRLQRLIELPGTIDRYPDGLAWTTGLHPDRPSGMPPLPIGSYGDDEDLLSQTGRLPLLQHLADVFDTAIRFTEASNLSAILKRTITHAAKLHDIGKADPRFQAMLLGKPVSVAHMQRTLWAKSDKFGGSSERELPSGFRHEMLSVDLLHHVTTKDHDCGNGQQSDRELLAHVTAAHHGCARPLAPVAADDSLPGFNLDSFSATDVSHEERASWIPSYRLDSGIGERFWNLNRRFGWWGLAYLESMLRLADWAASARPGKGNISALNFGSVTATSPRASSKSNRIEIVLTGIDGSRPLGFLTALGVFSTLACRSDNTAFRYYWRCQQGGWRPVISCFKSDPIDPETLIDLLASQLDISAENHPALRIAAEFEGSRRDRFKQLAEFASIGDRRCADWMSCNGSDAADTDAISQLQTSRRDYHTIAIRGLLCQTNNEHLRRTLFEPWEYADPIAGLSLHLEPREDRRHAYQWHTPSGDPTRKSSGGMIGANRLSLEAWPLFQSLPTSDPVKLKTTGFLGTRVSDTRLTWPIWTCPVTIELLQSLLNFGELQTTEVESQKLLPLSIERIYRCQKILVGKTPNLTPAVAVLA